MKNSEQQIIEAALKKATAYDSYRELMENLTAQGRSTGPVQTEPNQIYTELNIHRMNKWDKHFKVSEEGREVLDKLEKSLIWLVITESWCGDAAHSVPVFQKLAELSDKVNLEIVQRDENPELINQFLTNGGRSIPKLIILDAETRKVMGDWGPRPYPAIQLREKMVEEGESKEEISKKLQLWYARDRGKAIEAEVLQLLKSL